MSFKVGDKVIHFREGLSRIVEKTTMNGAEYFLVHIEREGGETIYVPVDKAEAIIRPIIDKKTAKELVVFVRTIQPEYITNTKQRRDNFKKKLTSGDIKDLAYLYRQLYFFTHPEELSVPVKFGPADVEMLKFATRTLFDELAISYSVDRDVIEVVFLKEIRSC